MGPVATAAIMAGLGGLGSLFGSRGKKKKEEEAKRQREADRKAQIAALKLQHQRAEDERTQRVALARALLGGDNISRDINIDPAVLDQLGQRREYNFEDVVPQDVSRPGTGGTYGFLQGLFGSAADAVASTYRPKSPMPSMGPQPLSSEELLWLLSPGSAGRTPSVPGTMGGSPAPYGGGF